MKEWRDDLAKKMDEHLQRLEQLHLAEYLAYAQDRRRLIRSHFLGGLARGAGMAIGFTILGAMLVIFLRHLAEQNLPLIGDFLAQLVTVVQRRLE